MYFASVILALVATVSTAAVIGPRSNAAPRDFGRLQLRARNPESASVSKRPISRSSAVGEAMHGRAAPNLNADQEVHHHSSDAKEPKAFSLVARSGWPMGLPDVAKASQVAGTRGWPLANNNSLYNAVMQMGQTEKDAGETRARSANTATPVILPGGQTVLAYTGAAATRTPSYDYYAAIPRRPSSSRAAKHKATSTSGQHKHKASTSVGHKHKASSTSGQRKRKASTSGLPKYRPSKPDERRP